jgi:hypothetical protein
MVALALLFGKGEAARIWFLHLLGLDTESKIPASCLVSMFFISSVLYFLKVFFANKEGKSAKGVSMVHPLLCSALL